MDEKQAPAEDAPVDQQAGIDRLGALVEAAIDERIRKAGQVAGMPWEPGPGALSFPHGFDLTPAMVRAELGAERLVKLLAPLIPGGEEAIREALVTFGTEVAIAAVSLAQLDPRWPATFVAETWAHQYTSLLPALRAEVAKARARAEATDGGS